MNKTINGDILDITEGVIVHQVNCQLVAGAGLAKQIADKWPHWKKWYTSTPHPYLGLVRVYYPDEHLYICNVFAQDNYGINKRHTNYAAMGDCLLQISRMFNYGTKIYIPHGIGCGLGGGDWDIVKEIIHDAIPGAILVKFKGK